MEREHIVWDWRHEKTLSASCITNWTTCATCCHEFKDEEMWEISASEGYLMHGARHYENKIYRTVCPSCGQQMVNKPLTT
jgi:hypothetical protein